INCHCVKLFVYFLLNLSEVIVPSQPVVSLVGEDVILPCHLDPVMNAFDMTVEWARPDLNQIYPGVAGRTSVFIDELEKGNISLKLSKVKVSDEGGYKCFMPALSKPSTPAYLSCQPWLLVSPGGDGSGGGDISNAFANVGGNSVRILLNVCVVVVGGCLLKHLPICGIKAVL
uniref:Ig-like domain-containing protein n=1 Tax=Labrus bergylta TaxID=56723 RepID=A0A3Q3M0U6_9LABR